MTQEQYNKSIATGELQLSNWNKVSYYFLVILLLFIPLMFLAFEIFDSSKNFVKPPVEFLIAPAILGFLLYFYQRRGLKFQVVEAKLGRNELLPVIKDLLGERNGDVDIVYDQNNILILKTDIGNGWRKSKQITILFDKNGMYINSIFDPKTNKSGADLTGSNKEIINLLIDRVQQAA